MKNKIDPVDEILKNCGLKGPWEPLQTTGLANRIYATDDVIIRIAKKHSEALRDARTESIAAPVAYAAGVLTPRLLVYDDSRVLLDGPYSIWERVHGETLGLVSSDSHPMSNTWHQVGHQMALLHVNVEPFEDPEKYLHKPERDLKLELLLNKLIENDHLSKDVSNEIYGFIDELRPFVLEESETCFIHSDIKDMNIMCTRDDKFLALIDWGDAGWGDPTFDFRQIPLSVIPTVLEGYREVAPNRLGETLKERIIWDKLYEGLMESMRSPSCSIPLDQFRQFLSTLNHDSI